MPPALVVATNRNFAVQLRELGIEVDADGFEVPVAADRIAGADGGGPAMANAVYQDHALAGFADHHIGEEQAGLPFSSKSSPVRFTVCNRIQVH